MAITMRASKIGDIPVLRVKGRVVNVDSEKFGKKLEAFCSSGAPKVVVEFTDADFIDSFGLGMLVRHYTLTQKSGREMVILNTNTNEQSYVHRLFEVTGLSNIFRIVGSAAEI